tara:strand:- start:1169 stop:1630 length:462 start_codon:yes stop_codon:yes gene_type:complete
MSLKQAWGNACWYLFHTLAYKLKDDRVDLVPQILANIRYVCANLPCPDCSAHAIETMKTLRHDRIKTKDALIQVLHQFHNVVNKKTGQAFFTRQEHDEKYDKARTDAICSNFIRVMQSRFPTNERGIVNDLQRKIMVKHIHDFITKERSAFND